MLFGIVCLDILHVHPQICLPFARLVSVRERTASKRYPSASPRPPLPRSVARALPDSTAILLPDKDTPLGHQGGTLKQIQSKVQDDHMHQARAFFLTCPQARAHASFLYAPHPSSIQFMPPNSLSAPSAERDATRMRRCKASRGATVNCCNHRSSNRRSRH